MDERKISIGIEGQEDEWSRKRRLATEGDFWRVADYMGYPSQGGWGWLVENAADAARHKLDPGGLLSGGEDPSDEVVNASVVAFRAGAIIGFCLGQTYPATPQELGTWPLEAIKKGHLEAWASAELARDQSEG